MAMPYVREARKPQTVGARALRLWSKTGYRRDDLATENLQRSDLMHVG
jgi:hypothetical protein